MYKYHNKNVEEDEKRENKETFVSYMIKQAMYVNTRTIYNFNSM